MYNLQKSHPILGVPMLILVFILIIKIWATALVWNWSQSAMVAMTLSFKMYPDA